MGRVLGICLLLVVVTAATFGRLTGYGYVGWDDAETLTGSKDFNPPTAQTFAKVWAAPRAGLYVPVTYTLWTGLAFLAYDQDPDGPGEPKLDPSVFHTANLLLHIASTLVCFALLRRLTHQDWAAAVGAMVFALHPVQVEPVAWVSGMKDVLFGLLSLSALLFYVLYAQAAYRAPDRDADQPRATGALMCLALAAVAFVLALLANPAAVVVPPMAIVIDRFLIGRRWIEVFETVATGIVLTLPVIVITAMIQPATTAFRPALWQRPLVALDALSFYLFKLIWPAQLCIDYGRLPERVVPAPSTYLTALVPVVLGAVLWIFRRRLPWLATGALLFVIGLLPLLGLVPVSFQEHSTVADHYLYLSMFGVALAVAGAVARYRGPALYTAAGVVIALLGVRSFQQTGYWSDPKQVWEHTLDVNPRSFAAHLNLGNFYFRDSVKRSDNAAMETALRHYEQAMEIRPNYHLAAYNRALALIHEGRNAEALPLLAQLLRIEEELSDKRLKSMPNLQYAAGLALFREGHYEWAASHFRRALEQNPTHPLAGQYLREAQARIPAPTTGPTTR